MPDDHDLGAVLDRLQGVETVLGELRQDIGGLKALMHRPAECSLAGTVRSLELSRARQGGALAIVGALGGIIAAGIALVVNRLWKG